MKKHKYFRVKSNKKEKKREIKDRKKKGGARKKEKKGGIKRQKEKNKGVPKLKVRGKKKSMVLEGGEGLTKISLFWSKVPNNENVYAFLYIDGFEE